MSLTIQNNILIGVRKDLATHLISILELNVEPLFVGVSIKVCN